MTKILLQIGGMTCGGCVASVTKVLKAVPGVADVAVNLQAGTADVAFDAARASPQALRAAIEAAGYDAL